MSLFGIGATYPHAAHRNRIKRYKENRKLFMGQHYEVFKRVQDRLSSRQNELLYISANIPGIVCKKSADFLFGETPSLSAGKKDDSPEQQAIERLVEENQLHITNYESALSNAYRGDSFYKVRYGQEYGGLLDKKIDPFRVFIEPQNPEFVFPETFPGDHSKILAFHIAYPQLVEGWEGEEWILHIESHYPGQIHYGKFRMNPTVVTVDNEVTEWKIYAEIPAARKVVETGVSLPLVIHVPNFSTDEGWEGIDDISEHKPLFDELNHRLSQIASILDKHADPAMAVPAGSLQEDENGNPIFTVAQMKIFEVMGKDDVIPSFITWDGQLQAAFQAVEKTLDLLLIGCEIPGVVIGRGDSGTSGSSGLAIKWMMNSLLAKVNRKRQYYDAGLKKVLLVAQLLEKSVNGKLDYEVTVPKIKFRDGLPNDELEMATIAQIRTGGKATLSTKSALQWLDGLTEEQAEAELERLKDEEEVATPSIFNQELEEPEEQEDSEQQETPAAQDGDK